ncbi:phospholipase D-like domain-containing protein [Salinarimonas rosea]|uniref:phospholipase D-like domain-containing protein n=1 Tax=Salinarimonas rosea TaxID=552063 RepID=UPI0003FE3165|nr:phospholipase D-like domain-containing protein [Salinarimonas rosea]
MNQRPVMPDLAEPAGREPQAASLQVAEAGEDTLARALTRVLADPGVPARHLRILRDGTENYPAWLAAIRGARERIDFENFIVADDETGRTFAEALIERARAGVRVRVLYDWLGSAARASRDYWRALAQAGVAVRVYGPLRPSRPHWFVRDHRKLLAVDGHTGFVSGLCVSDNWTGRAGVAPWRDTGIALSGPAAVAALEAAFAETWDAATPRRGSPEARPLPAAPVPPAHGAWGVAPPAGEPVPVRVVRGRPGDRRLYRLDLLALATARTRAFVTDSYFLPTRAYREALLDAARAGVDVRLLVPGANDVPTLPAFVRTAYRELIEAGVRVYEWSGPMLHAKTAVFDGRISRVGSTNLNPASWFGNFEIDVVVDDPGFGAAMEAMFAEDLAGATEIVLADKRGAPALPRPVAVAPPPSLAGRFAQGRWRESAASVGRVLVSAIAQRAPLSRLESASAATLAAMAAAGAVAIALWPGIVGFTLSVTLGWIALALVIRLFRERRRGRIAERRLSAQTRRLLERLRRRG